LTPSPIRKVLSSMRQHRVQYLLMGGQACVLYGGAEFSRDTDLVVLADTENLAHLSAALNELQAKRIAVPPFERRYLDMGLAVHFRCEHPEANKLRIDIMTRLRGVAPFLELWQRRTTLLADGETIELLALPDLVQAKKTQRDKDWPMIGRLLEANYLQNRDNPTEAQIDFWLKELRTPALLIEVATRYPQACQQLQSARGLLALALAANDAALGAALKAEEEAERLADRAYWQPLRVELERLRHETRMQGPPT